MNIGNQTIYKILFTLITKLFRSQIKFMNIVDIVFLFPRLNK